MTHPTELTGLGRPMDWRQPSNRFVALIFLVSLISLGAAALLYDWHWWRAVGGSIGVFVAWAIGRELDPAHPLTAGVASVAALGMAFVAEPALLESAAILIATRVISGTIGARISLVDVIVLAGLGFITGGAVWLWPVGISILAWLLVAPEVGNLRPVGFAALVLGFIVGWYLAPIEPLQTDPEGLIAAGSVLAVGLLSLVRCDAGVRTDARGGTVTALRVRLARAGSAVFVAAVLASRGVDALWDLGPVIAALTATAVVSILTPGSGIRGDPPGN